jgi:hypothetical protein
VRRRLKPALGRVARTIGWLCVAGRTIQVVGVLHVRALIAAEMKRALELDPTLAPLAGRSIVSPGPIEWFTNLLSLLWLPYAIWRLFRAARTGPRITTLEWLLLILAPLLYGLTEFLARSRTLYGYPLY